MIDCPLEDRLERLEGVEDELLEAKDKIEELRMQLEEKERKEKILHQALGMLGVRVPNGDLFTLEQELLDKISELQEANNG